MEKIRSEGRRRWIDTERSSRNSQSHPERERPIVLLKSGIACLSPSTIRRCFLKYLSKQKQRLSSLPCVCTYHFINIGLHKWRGAFCFFSELARHWRLSMLTYHRYVNWWVYPVLQRTFMTFSFFPPFFFLFPNTCVHNTLSKRCVSDYTIKQWEVYVCDIGDKKL